MADTTTKGFPYPEGPDPVDVAGDIQALAEAVDDMPGVQSYTGAEIAALAVGEKWAGRVVWNSTTGKLQVSNGSTFSDVDTSVALSSSTPQTLGTAAAGTSSDASRADHRHAMPSASDVGAVASALVNARGDLITATADDTPARLAVGNNGESLVADSTTTTGLRWQPAYNAGRNRIINGGFDVWARGTSFTNPASGGYTADRFRLAYDGSGATRIVSQQTFTPGTAPVAGYEGTYFLRFNQSVAGSGGTFNVVQQLIEDVRTLAGQTATVSFWAKASSNTTLYLVSLQQSFGSGGSGSVETTLSSSVSVTTSWQRFTFTGSVPSISGKTIGTNSSLNLNIGMPINATSTIDLWGVQVEAGAVATRFEEEPYEATLRKCQRYYWRQGGTTAFEKIALGFGSTATAARAFIPFATPMRAAPSSVDYSTLAMYDGTTDLVVTGVTLDQPTAQNTSLSLTFASGGTAGRAGVLQTNNSTSGYLALNAEL